jgi:SEC-C motif-containing protein
MYARCCGRFHKGELPGNALELMRSRYCAYALNLADYIMATTHPENPRYQADKPAWKKSLQQFSKNTLFDGLTILEFIDGDTEAFVTFRAHLRQHGQDASFTEKSRFLKEGPRWLYA